MTRKWAIEALNRLTKESKEAKLSGKEKAMAGAVRKALEVFCRQDEEFAQAVAQGGSFADCMKAVAKGVGNAISDLDVYKRAVKFYFRGADVRFVMEIVLCPADAEETKAGITEAVEPAEGRDHGDTMILKLEDFL